MADRSDPRAADPAPAPGPAQDFDRIYAAGTPPWDIGRPQPVFEDLADRGGLVGRVLDVGCGTGEHALLAATHGHESVGLDLSQRAVDTAKRKAVDRGLSATFVVADALRLADLGERFDTVLDCGLFHVFGDDDRARFVGGLGAVIPTGGCYHMLCFSDRQPGDWGPRRVSEKEIRTAFERGWAVDAIDPAIIDIAIDPDGALAWHLTAVRT